MNEYLHKTIPNLKPLNNKQHFESHFINKPWVLVNGISKKKSVYTFKNANILEIYQNNETIITSWTISVENIVSIKTKDGLIRVKAYFKDNDILVLNHLNKEEFALYINAKGYNEDLNSIDDVQSYLKEKYKMKLATLIYDHKFYFIEKSKEFGPFKIEILAKKVKNEIISPYCFVRDINEADYSKRLRICDLLQEI